jgi:predicted nuclease of predicted toxin-antitoxin system
MKILIDRNLSPMWVQFLVALGTEAVHLAARKSRGPSVIQVRTQDVLPTAIGAVVLRAIDAGREHLETGAIVSRRATLPARYN